MKTVFAINKDYDAFQIWASLRFASEEQFLFLSKAFEFDKSISKEIRASTDYADCAPLVEKLTSERYRKNERILQRAVQSYSVEWQKINDTFYTLVEKITGYRWQFQEYEVIVSLFHTGISNRNANTVLRSAYEDVREQTRITAHEILMIQLWYIFEKFFGKDIVANNERLFWSLNEITAVAILGLEPEMNVLWSERQKGFDNFLLNYPDMADLKGSIKKVYSNKQSFGEYLETIASLLPSVASKTRVHSRFRPPTGRGA